VKLVHLVGFITKKFVMMHGHMNVKKSYVIYGLNWIFWFHLLGNNERNSKFWTCSDDWQEMRPNDVCWYFFPPRF